MTATNPQPAHPLAPQSASMPASPTLCRLEAATLSHIRPQPIVDETFEALWIKDDGDLRRFTSAPTFAECRDAALQVSLKGMQFAVRVTHQRTGAVVLHVFQVRQESQAKWVGGTGVKRLYADRLAVLRVVEGAGR